MNNTNVSFQRYFLCEDTNIPKISAALKCGLNDIAKVSLNAFRELHVEKKIPLVFATRYGNLQQVLKIEKSYHENAEFSPVIFSKLSCNITAGIISILTQNDLPYTTISAGEKSFEYGLLEAFLQNSDEVIFLLAEESVPDPLCRIVNQKSYAFALHIQKNSRGEFLIEFRNSSQSKNVFNFINFLEENKDERFETEFFTITRNR